MGPVAMRGLSFGLAKSKQLGFGKSNPNEEATSETRENGLCIDKRGSRREGDVNMENGAIPDSCVAPRERAQN